MISWEQIVGSGQLHAYEDHTILPVCRTGPPRQFDDRFPRTIYVGPVPAPPETICQKCKTFERDHDPMFQAGREYERNLIRNAHNVKKEP
jgi:hypothetical protein